MSATDTTTVPEPASTGWPLQSLLDATGLTRAALARRLGVSGSTMLAAGERGLTDVQADEWAIRLGTHPLMVWGWAWIEEAGAARPAYARVADRLRQRVARGELRPGDRLPGVHNLAGQLGAGTRTVVRALDELRAEGIVVGGLGRGHHATIATTLPVGPAECVACGRTIEPGEEHYPHRPHCTMAAHAWCDCDQATHPECCPTCAAGVTA